MTVVITVLRIQLIIETTIIKYGTVFSLTSMNSPAVLSRNAACVVMLYHAYNSTVRILTYRHMTKV